MKQSEFTKLLDCFVVHEGSSDKKPLEDYCHTGLLVDAKGDPDAEIRHVVTGVSLRKELILRAIEQKADAIIVHHPNGFWKSEKDKRLIGTHGEYMRLLIQNGISLYGYHLHLDRHFLVGNNFTIGRLIQCEDPQRRLSFTTFLDGIGVMFDGCPAKETIDNVFPNGWNVAGDPEMVRRLLDPSVDKKFAVCSGSCGPSGLEEAEMLGADVLVTGEIRESMPIYAEEHGMAIIYAGHHRSEIFCVQFLADYIMGAGQFEGMGDNRFEGVTAEFIDIDNPV